LVFYYYYYYDDLSFLKLRTPLCTHIPLRHKRWPFILQEESNSDIYCSDGTVDDVFTDSSERCCPPVFNPGHATYTIWH
jgi:hypothetical protein